MRRAAVLLLIAWPVAASALDCSAAKTQVELNQCADRDFRKADAVQNLVYAKLKAQTTDPGSRRRLIAAQKAWLAYRDRECDFETEDSIGGSIRPMEMAECYREKTVAHTAELQKQLDCPEGDPACAR